LSHFAAVVVLVGDGDAARVKVSTRHATVVFDQVVRVGVTVVEKSVSVTAKALEVICAHIST
jgi:hypothetical protein